MITTKHNEALNVCAFKIAMICLVQNNDKRISDRDDRF